MRYLVHLMAYLSVLGLVTQLDVYLVRLMVYLSVLDLVGPMDAQMGPGLVGLMACKMLKGQSRGMRFQLLQTALLLRSWVE